MPLSQGLGTVTQEKSKSPIFSYTNEVAGDYSLSKRIIEGQ